MTRIFLWVTLASTIGAVGFALMAFPHPGGERSGALALVGLAMMASAVLVASFGLDSPEDHPDNETEN